MGFTITEDGEIVLNAGEFLEFIMPYAIVSAVAFTLGIIVCFLWKKKSDGLKHIIGKIYNSFKEKNIENIVFFVAVFLVILSIILQCFNVLDGFSNTVINIFGTLIVSWIATKKNSEEEIRKKEQENAKKSRRYLNSIKTTATNAIKIISDSIGSNELNFTPEQITILERAKDQMEHIETGIETSLFDWEDMMSQEDINSAHLDEVAIKVKAGEAANTVPGFNKEQFEREEQMNQEEA